VSNFDKAIVIGVAGLALFVLGIVVTAYIVLTIAGALG
jgi:hypothetical protein